MPITDDIVKTLKDPTPLYALAGTADLAAEKFREVAPLIEKLRAEAPERFEKVRHTDPKVVQERVSSQAKDAQAKAQARVNELLGSIEQDLKKIRDTAQDFALQQVGRAAEYAVKARETYDELAERGKGAVATWRGEAAEQVEGVAAAIEGHPGPAPESAPGTVEQAEEAASAKKAAAKKAAAKKSASKPSE